MTVSSRRESNGFLATALAVAVALLIPLSSVLAQSGTDAPRVGIVAEVNGDPITSYELERRFQRELLLLREAGNSTETLKRNADQIRKDVLELMILERLLLQRCDSDKIKVRDVEVEEHIMDRLKKSGQRVTSLAEFFRQYEERFDESEEEVRRRLRETLRIQALYRTVVARSYISPGELRAYYAAHREEFETEATYRYRHLFVPRGNPDLNQINEAIQKQLRDGVPFETLVKRFSEKFNKEEGGIYLLTDADLDQRKPPMPALIRSLKPGETSTRLSNEVGIHYFHLMELTPGDPISFEEAQEKIRVTINKQRQALQLDRLEKELREKAYIRRYLDPAG